MNCLWKVWSHNDIAEFYYYVWVNAEIAGMIRNYRLPRSEH